MNNIPVGTKWFRYLDDKEEPEVIRILGSNMKKNKIRYMNNDGKNITTDYESLVNNYKMLKADGIIILAIVKMGTDEHPAPNDVVISLKSLDLKKQNSNLPYAVCRQSVYDFFTNMQDQSMTHYGVCVSQDTCPSNIDFGAMLGCAGIEYSESISVYLDDTLSDILKLVKVKKYNDTLKSLKEFMRENYSFTKMSGFCRTLRELLETNSFMYDFKKCFDIVEVPFEIPEDRDSLNSENVLYLENELKENIIETYMIKYTREIDMKSIRRSHLLISSSSDMNSPVYLLGYDKSEGEYVPRTSI